ncbi:ATP-binding cassette domain-containing protein [Serratia marcescens]|nr:ATP-binding cassette domain-containing protein [Serratia marcescens]RTF27719.1 ATP-binding cassette domain-containing protein [Serratia marcescens]RTF44540.1 ATP-binding cassette domain-containing protein [Serratia marcescens]RTF57023.1 ATP-binding cassette domain-containing protein [Serratia marcescens]RTG24249.1 ATP-binding cassette domain-containing protein [Serratia marcescens]RTG41582.1 ATP-binding cassette domain-containing protein [Serratia marcescens]
MAQYVYTMHRVGKVVPPKRHILKNISLSFFPGAKIGVLGLNGAGKSTLLRIMAGIDTDIEGEARPQPGIKIGYLPQEPQLNLEHTVRESVEEALAEVVGALKRLDEVYALYAEEGADFDKLAAEQGRLEEIIQAHDGHNLNAQLERAADALRLPDWDAKIAHLSGGERRRVALCRLLLEKPDMLLLDEPTNHLDSAGRAWLYQQLDQWRGGLLIASHDRQLLGRMERIVELTPGALRSYGGNYEDYRRQRDTEQQAARADLEHAREERRRTRARQQKEHDMSQRRSAQTLRVVDTLNIASFERVAYKSAAKESLGTLRKQHQDRRDSLDAAVREAYQRVEEEPPVLLALPGSEVNANKQVLVLERLQLPFVSAPPLDLRIDGPMRVALTGPNGCGKSTLLKTLLGQLTALSGHCHCPLSTAYLDQTLSQLDPGLSVMEHLGLQDSPLAEGALRTRLAQLQLGADRIALPLGSLSGGERLKAALACALWRRQPAQLLLLDEPTNHLDLASSLAIETALADFPGAMLVVSHDEDFLQALRPTHRLNRQADGWRLQAW